MYKRQEVENLKKEGINPGLAVIIVGEDPAKMCIRDSYKRVDIQFEYAAK